MKNIVKKLLIGVISLSLLGSVSLNPSTFNINVSAKTRIHHKRIHKKRATYDHKRHKRIKHHRRITRRKRAVKNRSHKTKSHKIKSTSYSSQMSYQTLRDINKDRKRYGISSIKEIKPLNRLAKVRAHQLIHNFSHYHDHGKVYYEQDAKKMKINLTHYYHNHSASGENIATAGLDYSNISYTNMPNDPHRYVNKNGYDMANMDEDSMFNYDSGSAWGHRKNILDKNFRYVGIGVAHKGNHYYIAEDFDS